MDLFDLSGKVALVTGSEPHWTANEIARAAVFLASRAGSFMTGQAIVIDGGVTIA